MSRNIRLRNVCVHWITTGLHNLFPASKLLLALVFSKCEWFFNVLMHSLTRSFYSGRPTAVETSKHWRIIEMKMMTMMTDDSYGSGRLFRRALECNVDDHWTAGTTDSQCHWAPRLAYQSHCHTHMHIKSSHTVCFWHNLGFSFWCKCNEM